MPPPWRNHRDPTGVDTPTTVAASSLERPSATLSQNCRCTSRPFTVGRPGDRIGARPTKFVRCARFRAISNSLDLEALRRPLESALHAAIRYTERLAEAGAVASVGSKGDSYDNAMAEAFNSLFKAELVRNHGPWKNIDDLEIAVAEYIDWFNYRRLHGEIGLVPPVEYETTHRSTTLPEQPAQREFEASIKPGT